jgi:hypothetical protein
MRKTVAAVAALTLFAAVPNPSAAQATIEGTWLMTLESPEGVFNIPITFTRDGERLVATVPGAAEPIFTGRVTSTGVEFQWALVYQGMDLPTTLVGSFANGEWSGSADFGGAAAGTWVARRPPAGGAAAPAPSGGGQG